MDLRSVFPGEVSVLDTIEKIKDSPVDRYEKIQLNMLNAKALVVWSKIGDLVKKEILDIIIKYENEVFFEKKMIKKKKQQQETTQISRYNPDFGTIENILLANFILTAKKNVQMDSYLALSIARFSEHNTQVLWYEYSKIAAGENGSKIVTELKFYSDESNSKSVRFANNDSQVIVRSDGTETPFWEYFLRDELKEKYKDKVFEIYKEEFVNRINAKDLIVVFNQNKHPPTKPDHIKQNSIIEWNKLEMLKWSISQYKKMNNKDILIGVTYLHTPTMRWNLQENNAPKIIYEPKYYDYTNDKGVYVLFGNHVLGGGVFGSGMVQEEIINFEFPEMLFLNHYYAKMKRLYTNKNDSMTKIGELADEESYLWKNLTHVGNFDQKYYGPGFRKKISYGKGNDFLTEVKSGERINFVSINAKESKEQKKSINDYTFDDFKYHLTKAFVGFRGAKVAGINSVHTGAWGAGAFKQLESWTFAIQYLAAWNAGISEFYYYSKSKEQIIEYSKFNNVGKADKLGKLKLLVTPDNLRENLKKVFWDN